MYEEEIKFLNKVEEPVDENRQRVLFSESECKELKAQYLGLPDEYTAYLMEIGAGSAREDQYMIYDNPVLCHEDDEFSWYDSKGINYLVIGDDFSGNLYALKVDSEYAPVLLDHECMEEFLHEGSIKSFFRKMMLMDEFGNDERQY